MGRFEIPEWRRDAGNNVYFAGSSGANVKTTKNPPTNETDDERIKRLLGELLKQSQQTPPIPYAKEAYETLSRLYSQGRLKLVDHIIKTGKRGKQVIEDASGKTYISPAQQGPLGMWASTVDGIEIAKKTTSGDYLSDDDLLATMVHEARHAMQPHPLDPVTGKPPKKGSYSDADYEADAYYVEEVYREARGLPPRWNQFRNPDGTPNMQDIEDHAKAATNTRRTKGVAVPFP